MVELLVEVMEMAEKGVSDQSEECEEEILTDLFRNVASDQRLLPVRLLPPSSQSWRTT